MQHPHIFIWLVMWELGFAFVHLTRSVYGAGKGVAYAVCKKHSTIEFWGGIQNRLELSSNMQTAFERIAK